MTCCATTDGPGGRPGRPLRLAATVIALATIGCGSGDIRPASTSVADLTNPQVSPSHSQWLVGPIARMATRQEIDEYLRLASDEAAVAFIEDFWERRKPYPLREDNPLRALFEARAAEADRLYSEAGYLGRRTDRGTIHVLYGAPKEVDYDVSPHPDDPPVIVWRYDAVTGLDGRRPEPYYRFIRRGDITELYRPARTVPTGRHGVERPVVERPSSDVPPPPP